MSSVIGYFVSILVIEAGMRRSKLKRKISMISY